MNIKILGTGCSKCKHLHNKISELSRKHNKLEVEYISNLSEIMEFGIMSIPAIVIDGEVKTSGRVPSDKELLELLGIVDA